MRRGTRKAIFALRQVIEKKNRKSKPTFIPFVDLEKAFDSIKRKTLFQILKKTGITNSDRIIIKSLFENETGVVRYGESQEITEIKKGIRQGCSLSPCLFNLYTYKKQLIE
ncbi:Reverse transcriptase domain [Cinara cedri]|uniref:Reverse transcriptase domain n=1 Tax=Cinara cedri TaxID=506608 RepID=A0A5E4NQC0_9HEMI|nr:Reverse transcriptase domain [Cinara cedri]